MTKCCLISKRSESHWRGAGEFHGGGGPLGISRMEGPDLLFEAHRAAAEMTGIPFNPDPNGAEQDGISHMESTVTGGRRASTARAYLAPAMRRPNLTVATGAMVSRIVLKGNRAVAVDYVQRGQTIIAHADQEIVLSAGAYGSPQISDAVGHWPAG